MKSFQNGGAAVAVMFSKGFLVWLKENVVCVFKTSSNGSLGVVRESVSKIDDGVLIG